MRGGSREKYLQNGIGALWKESKMDRKHRNAMPRSGPCDMYFGFL